MNFIRITLLLIGLLANAQKNSIIQLEGYYGGQGVIFCNDTSLIYDINNFKSSTTSNIYEIKIAEDILFKDYNAAFKTFGGDTELYRIKDVRKKYWYYNRQYVSYINKNGDSLLIINLLNFKNKVQATQYFPDWETEFNSGVGEYYEKNRIIFTVNLKTKVLTLGINPKL